MEDERGALAILKSLVFYVRYPKDALDNDRRQWSRITAKREMRRLGLEDMYKVLHPVSYKPDWPDLLNIYKLTRRLKPKVIFEFGSGCSTLIFAKALADNDADGHGKGIVYSIETSLPFKQYTERYLPAELKPYVEMVHSEMELGEMAGQKVMWHKTIPDAAPNLVYLDGPDYQDFSSEIEIQVEGIMLEAKAPNDYTILIDGRWYTQQFTRENLKRRYKVTENKIDKWLLLEAVDRG